MAFMLSDLNKAKKNIAVFFGGKSPEHEVSVITGVQVINNMDLAKFNPLPIYVSKDGRWFYGQDFKNPSIFRNIASIPLHYPEVNFSFQSDSKDSTEKKSSGNKSVARLCQVGKPNLFGFGKKLELEVDCIFPAFHGGLGEDGSFQGLFEIYNIPYVGSGVAGSVLGIDKVLEKDIQKAHNIPSADFAVFYKNQIIQDPLEVIRKIEREFSYPVFVKPAVGGSSIGVAKAIDSLSLKNGLEVAAMLDQKVIVEQGIENAREINISVMGNSGSELQVSSCEEVFHTSGFLTYEDKYSGKGKAGMASATREIPAKLSMDTLSLVQATAKEVFNILDCNGLARVDFLVKENPLRIYVLEINTIPGSMSFYLWEASGIDFKTLISRLIELAEERFLERSKRVVAFESDILKNFDMGVKSSRP